MVELEWGNDKSGWQITQTWIRVVELRPSGKWRSGLGAGTRFREGSCSKTQALGTSYREEKRWPDLVTRGCRNFCGPVLPFVMFDLPSSRLITPMTSGTWCRHRIVPSRSSRSSRSSRCLLKIVCIDTIPTSQTSSIGQIKGRLSTPVHVGHACRDKKSGNKTTYFPIRAYLMLGPICWKTRKRI